MVLREPLVGRNQQVLTSTPAGQELHLHGD
jgi:hypothetical protein